MQVKNHILNGLIGYFRVGILTIISIVMLISGVNAHVLVIGIYGLLKQIIYSRFLSKAAYIFVIPDNSSRSKYAVIADLPGA